MGAHTVGHIHTTASKFGYIVEDLSADVQTNAWDPTPFRLDNHYYQNIIGPKVSLVRHMYEERPINCMVGVLSEVRKPKHYAVPTVLGYRLVL